MGGSGSSSVASHGPLARRGGRGDPLIPTQANARECPIGPHFHDAATALLPSDGRAFRRRTPRLTLLDEAHHPPGRSPPRWPDSGPEDPPIIATQKLKN
jgi:hypothetical protein